MPTQPFRPGHEAVVTNLPACWICAAEGRKRSAAYDANLPGYGWGNVCSPHFRDYRGTTGVGVGQRLILASDVREAAQA